MPSSIDASPHPGTELRGFVRRLWLSVIALNLLVIGFAAYTLHSAWQARVQSARANTQNLSMLLDREIASAFDHVDLSLRTLADHYAEKRRLAPFPAEAWNADLLQQRAYLPMLAGMRGSDASGTIVYGLDVGDPVGGNAADREFFRVHRDRPDAGLLISQPILARLTNKPSLILSRRLNDEKGNFAGIVAASIPLAHFSKLFETIKLGSHGSIGMRDADLRLIVRYPELANGGQTGSIHIADEFSAMLRRDPLAGSYDAGATSIDGIRRAHSYRRNARYPFYINVGIAEEDYLAPWYRDLVPTSSLAGLFLAVSLILARKYQGARERQQAATDEVATIAAQFRQRTENVADIIWSMDPDNRFTYVSPSDERIRGYRADEVIGRHLFSTLTEESIAAVRQQFPLATPDPQPGMDSSDTFAAKLELRCKDGRCIWAEVLATIERDAQGTLVGYHGVTRDITERINIEQRLRSMNELLEREVHLRTKRLRDLSVELTMIEERERRILAQDLHDNLGQLLAVARIKLSALGPDAPADSVPQIIDLIEQADLSARMITRELSPPILHTLGLEAALQSLANEMDRTYKLYVRIDSVADSRPLVEELQAVLYRCVRELLINVAKHARTDEATVTILPDEAYLTLAVADDGCGFDPAGNRATVPLIHGFGLDSISERIRNIGGEVDIDSSPGRGTTISLRIPWSVLSREAARP